MKGAAPAPSIAVLRRGPGVPLALAAGLVLLAVLPARGALAQASPALLCVVNARHAPGPELDALEAAMVLEQRKRGIVVGRTLADRREDCPPASPGRPRILVILQPDGDAVVIGPSGGTQPLALGSMDPVDRVREVARQAIGLVPGPEDRGPTPVVEGALAMRLPEPRPAGLAVAPRGFTQIGGRYEARSGSEVHAGGLDAELGLSILDGQFEIGARGGWLRGRRSGTSAGSLTMDVVPVEVVARGGPRVGRVLLRLGASAGLEWRRVAFAHLPRRPRELQRTDVVACLGGEVEIGVDLVPGVRLGVAGTVHGFPGGTRYAWLGTTLFEPPRIAAGAALRLVATWPGGRR